MTESIKFPSMRKNIIFALEFLANSQSVQRIHEVRDGNIVTYYDFDMAVHQLFDDAGDGFAENPEEYLGYSIRNKREAIAIKQLIKKLDIVLSQDNPEDIDATFVKTERWQEVIIAAKAAMIEFGRA